MGRLQKSKQTIFRSLKRMKAGVHSDIREEIKEEREYEQKDLQQFAKLPELEEFVNQLKDRKLVDWMSNVIGKLKTICDYFKIFPSMLNMQYAKQWKREVGDKMQPGTLRGYKNAIRAFMLSTKRATAAELKSSGFDMKMEGIGKYAHIKLTQEHIDCINKQLENDLRVNVIFRMGYETCMARQEYLDVKYSNIFDVIIPEGLPGAGEIAKAIRVFRGKTDARNTAFPSKTTYEILMKLKNGKDEIFTTADVSRATKVLKECYRKCGIDVAYFYMHAIHALRHTGAQRLLEQNEYNTRIVAPLGRWKSEQALSWFYGAVPEKVILRAGLKVWNS